MAGMHWTLLDKACRAADPAEIERLFKAVADPNRVVTTNRHQRPLHRTLELRIAREA
jgi:hypothetical protein